MRETEISKSFDSIASGYDEIFTLRERNLKLRSSIWAGILKRIQNNSRILELGCGTGEDALFFAKRGISVYAVDVSSEMVQLARQKLQNFPDLVRFQCCSISELVDSPLLEDTNFDLILSNFGAVNCLASLDPIYRLSEKYLKPDGWLSLCLINRHCLRELFRWNLRRLHTNGSPVRVGTSHVRLYYHAPREFRRPGYRIERVKGLGVLRQSDTWSFPPLNRLGDHYQIILQKSVRLGPWLHLKTESFSDPDPRGFPKDWSPA